MPSGAAVASPHLSCFVTSHVVHRPCRLYCAQASFQNAAPASLFTEIWYKFYDSRTGRHTKKPPAQNKKCHKVKLYNLCQNKVERFMSAVVADNQDEGKLIFLLVLQSYNGPCHPPPGASLVTSFMICICALTGKSSDGKGTLFRQLDHNFHPNITKPPTFTSVLFPVSRWGQIPQELAMSRTNILL